MLSSCRANALFDGGSVGNALEGALAEGCAMIDSL
jgi:hypothetical protein